jgi:hypothetical protein
MASKSTNRTIWTIGLLIVLAFLVWKVWPAIKGALNRAGGGGSSGGAGSIGSGGQYPYQGNPSQGSGGPSFGAGGGPSGGSGGGFSSAGQAWQALIQDVQQGWQNAWSLPSDSGMNLSDTIPYVPLQTLDDLPSWTPDDPNAPWNDGSGDEAAFIDDQELDDSIPGAGLDDYSGGGSDDGDYGDNGGGESYDY